MGVTILLHDEHSLVGIKEISHRWMEREPSDSQVIHTDPEFRENLLRFNDRPVDPT